MLQRALPPALFSLLLVVSHASAVPHDFKDHYRNKARAPGDGPPASSHASKDGSLLSYDIGGLVGGYVLTVLIWGVLLLTVGRRMRRRALQPPKQLELELQEKPTNLAVKTPGPTSPPLSARSWLKKFKKTDSAVGSPHSPPLQSPSSFDQKVIDAHKDQAQSDMERLYAAVMDHDAKKHYSKVSVEEETNGRRPSNMSARSHEESPISPVKAIYPPDYAHGRDRLREQPPPASPRSILSKRSAVSTSSANSKSTRFNLKNLRISGPVQKYPGAASDDEARTPLSPRFYQPGAPPSPPTQQNSPTTPYDPDEELDQVQPLPRPAPQRLASGTSSPAQTPGISLPKSNVSSTSSLPLRSFAEPLASPGIQTTVLDRRVDKLSMTTPKTGVPFTPYSPYMPFTPITPVTPHLVSKRDRKMAAKGARRATRKEELVQSPKEIFGDAY
ncbi:hypothetical protein IQ07DRAFT_585432 [Pyrenochaeta sp. DS3sAY3a]|nr:hypothetical protein IQ07DRAFT_585432 [Pyrenochaeta sp. DS3sAY3a]